MATSPLVRHYILGLPWDRSKSGASLSGRGGGLLARMFPPPPSPSEWERIRAAELAEEERDVPDASRPAL